VDYDPFSTPVEEENLNSETFDLNELPGYK
jgi:hypothetical protein